MSKFSAVLSAHKFMLRDLLPYSKKSGPILNCRNLLTFLKIWSENSQNLAIICLRRLTTPQHGRFI